MRAGDPTVPAAAKILVIASLMATVAMLPSAPPLDRTLGQVGARAPASAPVPSGAETVSWDANLSLVSNLTGSIALSAMVTLPGGELDAGSQATRAIEVDAPSAAEATLRFNGSTYQLPIPALGTIGPFEVPGLNYSYHGVPFHIYATLATSIEANCSASAVVSGCSTGLVWAASGSHALGFTAPAAPGPLSISLSGLDYVVGVNLTARCTVPFLGNVSVPVPLPESLPPFPGNPRELNGSIEVVPRPAIHSFSVAPDAIAVRATTTFTANASGGSGPLTLRYSGLPTGCLSENASAIPCSPGAPGTYVVTVTATDPQGDSANRTVELNVTGTAASTDGGGSGDATSWELAAALAGAAALAIAGYLVGRRRSRPPAPTAPPPPPSA